ncbi:MAG: ERF family protein, partial [Intestinibacter sp.]|uniref:ERF family protein n=1 Tax=Intestinibacter sp. TaxID=1965304 RepID=UPI003F171EF5
MSIYEKLLNIQTNLKAPKGQFNDFGGYAYRSCEDILGALKPLLNEQKVIVLISDDIVNQGGKNYIKATVKFIDIETGESIESSAFDREEENKKGMDSSQITGSCSSYARKYALNGMFAIDDIKDSDATNKHGKDKNTPNKQGQAKTLSDAQLKRLFAIASKAGIKADTVKDQVKKKFNK